MGSLNIMTRAINNISGVHNIMTDLWGWGGGVKDYYSLNDDNRSRYFINIIERTLLFKVSQ